MPFELASVLLLMAMIGAIVLARRDIVVNEMQSEDKNVIRDSSDIYLIDQSNK